MSSAILNQASKLNAKGGHHHCCESSFGARVVQRWRYSWSDGHVRGVDVYRVRAGLIAEKFSYVKG